MAHLAVWRFVILFLRQTDRPQPIMQVHPSNPNGSATGVVGTKDVSGLRAILLDYTRPGDLVVDPFAGTATVGQACVEMGRRYVGAECDPETHAKGLRRLAGVTPPLPGVPFPDRWAEGPEQGDILRGGDG